MSQSVGCGYIWGRGSLLDYRYSTPGQPGYEANLHEEQLFSLDAAFEPTVAMLKLPEGKSMATPSGQAMAAAQFRAAEKAGVVAVADYANTHDPKFILDNGKSAGHAVTLSGLTVTVGLLSLVFLSVPYLQSVGYGSMLLPIVATASGSDCEGRGEHRGGEGHRSAAS